MAYAYDVHKKTGAWEIFIDTACAYGYYSYNGMDIGGLWFNNRELDDFDGGYGLPIEVKALIEQAGYIVSDDFVL